MSNLAKAGTKYKKNSQKNSQSFVDSVAKNIKPMNIEIYISAETNNIRKANNIEKSNFKPKTN